MTPDSWVAYAARALEREQAREAPRQCEAIHFPWGTQCEQKSGHRGGHSFRAMPIIMDFEP